MEAPIAGLCSGFGTPLFLSEQVLVPIENPRLYGNRRAQVYDLEDAGRRGLGRTEKETKKAIFTFALYVSDFRWK